MIDEVAKIPPSPVRKLVVFALALTLLTGWNHPLIVDDIHTMLESIGQVAYRYPESASSDAPIPNQAFWADDSVQGVWNATKAIDNGNMLVNQLLTHFSVRIFGTSQTYWFGLCSVAGYCLSIVYAWRLAAMLLGPRVALWTAAFCAVNPTLLELANSKRSYSIATAFGLIATVAFLKLANLGISPESLVRKRNPILAVLGYSGAALIGFYSHFLFVTILLAHVLYTIMFVRDRITWIRLICSGLLVIAVVFAWLIFGGVAEAMKSYPELNRYCSFREEQEKANMFGVVTPGFVVASILNNFCYFFGFDKLLPEAKVRIMSIFLLLPGLLALLGRRKVRDYGTNQIRALFLLASCALISPIISVLRSTSTGNLMGMSNIYQSFGIPFVMCLIAYFCEPCEDQERSRVSTTTASYGLQRAVAQLVLVLLCLGVASYASRYNALINENPYHRLVRAAQSLRSSDDRMAVHVPTLLDAQLISFFAGAETTWDFTLDAQSELDPIVSDRMKRLGFRAPIVSFMEYERLVKKPGERIKKNLMIDRFDGRKTYMSRDYLPGESGADSDRP